MSESRELITTDEVQRSILNRIMMGRYEPGDRLPSVRDLAAELGSNRNTVNKAYQSLVGLGVIEAGDSSREGFRVRGLADLKAHSGPPFADYLYQQVTKLVWAGMAAGLSAVLGTEIACGVLRDFHKRAARLTRDFDLVITTFHHLAEVARHAAGDEANIVGIDTRLTPETLLSIARLPRHQVGIVCGVSATAHMLEHVLHGYYPALQLRAVTADEAASVLELAEASDHVIATHTCVEEVEALIGRPVDVVVKFQVDEQSLTYLKQKIQKVQASKLARAPAARDLLREGSV